ncbi:hypothetical protein O9K51_02248 [Purpureocillium lavendulum]|uniref:HTH La-type RNA-binding domain-containing protein n=1 Tax=Purpureocillium lavendulum TaxID=1247861 RepID=A0AB34FX03_9HYPO|nr:hypothetical protein O9K51_02248 [Purpureocillium lavendulum]
MATNPSTSGGDEALKATGSYVPLEAPHKFVEAPYNVPRDHGYGLSPGSQAAFAAFYPNGLPVTYNMVHGYDSSGVPNKYVENHLHPRYYTHPPATAQGKFSTMYGQQPFRKMGEVLVARRVHLWSKDEIQSVCNSLRLVFWADMKRLTRPYHMGDLWEFFDAHDLYHYGALNLWNVINTLYDENKLIANQWNAEAMLEIGHFADQWLKKPENRAKLADWNSLQGGIICLLSGEDWKEIGDLQDEEMSLLNTAMHHRRDLLLSGGLKQYNVPPPGLWGAMSSGNVINWLAGAPILGKNGLPSPPAAEPHSSTMNPAVPCFVQDGNHSYHAMGQNAPAETARTSSVVTESGVVIAMGSSVAPPGWDERVAETAARAAAAEGRNTQQSAASAVALQDDHDADESKQAAAEDNNLGPMFTAAANPSNLEDVSQPSAHKQGETLADHGEMQNPKATALQHENGSQEPNTAHESTLGQSEAVDHKPGDALVAQDDETDNPIKTQPQQPMASRHITTGDIYGATGLERMGRQSSEAMTYGQEMTYAGAQASPMSSRHSSAMTMVRYPCIRDGDGPCPAADWQDPRFDGANSPELQNPVPAMNVGPGAIAARFPGGRHSARVESAGPPPPPLQQQQQQQQRNYTAPDLSRGGGGGRGGSNHGGSGGWGHGHSRASSINQGHYHSPPRGGGGSWTGGRGRGRHRGGGHSAYRGASGYGALQAGGPPYEHAGFEARPQWQLQSGPQNEAHAQGGCRNEHLVGGRFIYRPCSCVKCNINNRSVMVRVDEQPDTPIMDVQTKVRYGLWNRFGEVETVLPTELQDGISFLVRFRNEWSVPEALAFGTGDIPEKNVSVAISAVMKSKWVNTTWHQPGQPGAYQHMPAHLQPAMPMAMPMPNPPLTAFGYPHMLPPNAPCPGPDFGRAIPSYMHPNLRSGSFPNTAHSWYPAPPSGLAPRRAFADGHQPAPAGTCASHQGQPHADKTTLDRLRSEVVQENQSPRAQRSSKKHQELPVDASAQSKPPCEEALDDLSREGNAAATSPVIPGALLSPTKARVLLPTTSPSKPLQTAVKRTNSRKHTKNNRGQPKNAEEGKGGVQEKKRAASGIPPGSPSSKQKRPNDFKAEPTKLGDDRKDKPDTPDTPDTPDAPDTGDTMDAQSPTQGTSKVPAPAPIDVKPSPTKPSVGTQRRTPSLFTDDQIKDRKRNWDRIPMPLDPLKAKKPADASGGSTPSQPTETDGRCAQSAATEPPFSPWIPVSHTADAGATPTDASSAKSGSDGGKTPVPEPDTKAGPSGGDVQAAESTSGIQEQPSSQQTAESSGMTAPTQGSAHSSHSHGSMRGRGHFRQQSRSVRRQRSQSMSGRSSRQSSHSKQGGTAEGGVQGTHAPQESQSGPGDGEIVATDDQGSGTVRRKKGNKKKKTSSYTFAPQPRESAEIPQPQQDSSATSQPGGDLASQNTAQAQSAPRPTQASMLPQTDLPLRTRNWAAEADRTPRAAPFGHVGLSRGPTGYSFNGSTQPQHGRHSSRSEAGGSLRMSRARRPRLEHLFDAPPPPELSAQQGAGATSLLRGATAATLSPDVVGAGGVGSTRDGQPPRQSAPAKTILLNPRAQVFVSPRQEAVKVVTDKGKDVESVKTDGGESGGASKDVPETQPTTTSGGGGVTTSTAGDAQQSTPASGGSKKERNKSPQRQGGPRQAEVTDKPATGYEAEPQDGNENGPVTSPTAATAVEDLQTSGSPSLPDQDAKSLPSLTPGHSEGSPRSVMSVPHSLASGSKEPAGDELNKGGENKERAEKKEHPQSEGVVECMESTE